MREAQYMRLISALRTALFVFAVLAAFFFSYGGIQQAAAAGEKPVLIAHGGGTIEGYGTTNSIEAVRQAIAEGYELIELDMDFSGDGGIIMIHDWDRTSAHYFGSVFERKLDEKEFERILIHDKFHTLTFEKLKPILDEAPHVRIVTDVKGDNLALLSQIAQGDPAYVSRIIPQIYAYDQYEPVKDMGYTDIILTLYAMPYIDYGELLHFAGQNDLYAITVGDGYDSVIMDLKYKLAGDGLTVYYHPVSRYEHAAELLEGGVHGVYASMLIPQDFEEPQRSYYLLENGEKLQDTQTADRSRKAITGIYVKNGAGKRIEYAVDGEEMTDELLAELTSGQHKLSVFITVFGKTAELPYILWVEDNSFRILDERYAYRIKEVKQPPEMSEAFREAEVEDSVREVLMHSLIAKSGEDYAYNDGAAIKFEVGGEALYARSYYNGAVLVPLSECARALGASSVVMDGSRYVYVYYEGVRTLMQANTFYISQGYKAKALQTPLILYRSKTMASGEVLSIITGRQYIGEGDLLIVLPEGAELSGNDLEALLYGAGILYK